MIRIRRSGTLNMKMNFIRSLAVFAACSGLLAQSTTSSLRLLTRRYREGETLQYHMKAMNDGRRYEVQASAVVKKDEKGVFIEEFAWSNVISNGAQVSLPPASAEFRQVLSLDPRKLPGVPKLAGVHPILIGPITDLLTFYADVWLAAQVGNLRKVGDHKYQTYGTPSSWADGNRVVLGEDSIDFDMTLQAIDETHHTATLLVRHVPPDKSKVKLPAAWMQEPVAGTSNNWVEVMRDSGKYIAAVGQETFDVHIVVSLLDGKIVAGTIENPVKAVERDCKDEALTNCGDPRPREIMRRIEIALAPAIQPRP